MKLNKLFATLLAMSMVVCMSMAVAFADSGDITKEESLVSGESVLETSGEQKIDTINEEEAILIATSGDPEEAGMAYREEGPVSGEEAIVISGDAETALSGDEEVVTSGEAIDVVSGEEVAPVSGETAEETSGDVLPKDVAENAWYAEYVKNVINAKLMTCDEEGNFNPDKYITRRDLFEAFKIAFGKTYNVDIDNLDEFLNQPSIREEVMYIVYSYAQSLDKGFKDSWMFLLDYADRDKISEEAYESVAWCVMNKIILGRDDNTLGAQDYATRAEFATIMTRTMEFFK